MGCGILDNIKMQLQNTSIQFETSQFDNSQYIVSNENNKLTLSISTLNTFQQLFLVMNNTKINTLNIQTSSLPIQAIIKSIPTIQHLLIENQEIDKFTYLYTEYDIIKALLIELNYDIPEILHFLEKIYGCNPFFKCQNVIYSTNLSKQFLTEFHFLNFFPYLRSLNLDHSSVSDEQIQLLECQLFEFSAWSSQIRSLELLNKFVFLRKLTLCNCKLGTGTLQLQYLTHLKVDNCCLKFLDCEKCENLEQLIANENEFEEVKLGKMVQWLELGRCQLKSVEFLRQLNCLKVLILDRNDVKVDLQMFEKFNNLGILSLDFVKVVYASKIIIFERINNVRCQGLDVSLNILQCFQKCRELDINGVQMFEELIRNKAIFINLELLLIGNVDIERLDEIQVAFPQCLVIMN